ncbi:MAG TPA: hypothetical protein DEF36_14735 [Desulfotomaculum sp.]|nr:hypothetical protein [Desulfotomaculum sp.]
MDRIRLLIASEDSSSRRGLTAIFSTEGLFEVIGDYPVDDAIEKSVASQPDIMLLDLSDEIADLGKKIIHLKSECPCSLILALIENEYLSRIPEMLAQGVDGCVPRGIIRGCLVKTVELACRSGILCLPGSFKKIASMAGSEKVVNIGELKNGLLPNSGEYLTKREMEILQLMAKNNSNREIAHKLFISEPTVKTHVSSILRKLGQSNRAHAIVYSYKIGLVNEALGCIVKTF